MRNFTIICATILILAFLPLNARALPYGEDTVEDALLNAEKRLKGKKLHSLLQGKWKVEVPEPLQREIRILELALDLSTNDTHLNALSPSASERETYAGLRKMLEERPDSVQIAEAQGKLQALSQNEIHFGEKDVVMRIAGAEQTQTYKIVSLHTNTMQIYWIGTNELNDLVFINANTLRIFEGGDEKVRLSRL